MSKYIKLEDAINAIEDKIAEYIPVLYGKYYEMPLEIRMAIESLPTIDIVRCRIASTTQKGQMTLRMADVFVGAKMIGMGMYPMMTSSANTEKG